MADRFAAASMPQYGGLLQATLIDTEAALRTLRAEWNELLQASASDKLFLTWEWLYTWWQHLAGDRTLYVIALRHDERLVALAPLALRPRRWKRLMPFRALEFLGCGNVGSDYLAPILRPGYEDAATRVLAAYLGDTGYALEFSHVDSGSLPMRDLAAQLRQRGWHEQHATVEFCPYIALAGHTWDSYLATLGRTHRTNFKRKLKKLNTQYALRIEEATSDSARRVALDILVELHLKRRREAGGSDALHRSELLNFHDELTALALRRNWLRLYVMWLDSTPVAAMYGFEYDKVFYFYQSGFDTQYASYSVGLVMAGLVIKNAIERGVREFDFLHGEESYKYLWASAERELLRYQFYPPQPRGALLDRWMQTRRRVLRLVTRRLPARYGARPRTTGRTPPAWSTQGQEAE